MLAILCPDACSFTDLQVKFGPSCRVDKPYPASPVDTRSRADQSPRPRCSSEPQASGRPFPTPEMQCQRLFAGSSVTFQAPRPQVPGGLPGDPARVRHVFEPCCADPPHAHELSPWHSCLVVFRCSHHPQTGTETRERAENSTMR